jgi:hypothetical protein
VTWQLETCLDGNLVFTYSKDSYKRTMEFEVRAYTAKKDKLAEGEEPTELEAGPYVADMR